MMRRMPTSSALFRSLLDAADWTWLAAPVQRLHGDDALLKARGRAKVDGASHAAARLLRRLLGLPELGDDQALALTIERRGQQETWTRQFARSRMRSTLQSHRGTHLHERLGAVSLYFSLHRDNDAIDWQLQGVRLLGLPLPRACAGKVRSRSGARNGRYAFHIDVRLPLLGRLVAYEGWLEIEHGH
jgi:hypothetical protein